jgi:hypothetical protein
LRLNGGSKEAKQAEMMEWGIALLQAIGWRDGLEQWMGSRSLRWIKGRSLRA